VTHTHVFALFALSTSLVLAGCRGDDPAGTATEGESTSEGSTGTPTTGGLPTTSGTTDDSTTTTTTGTPTTTNNSNGFIDPMTSGGETTAGPGPQPNGAQCQNDDQCESMNCYTSVILMGGVCSDCNEDSDCMEAGTGISCTISATMMFAVCEDGSTGDNCSSEDACQEELFCEDLIPIPGILPGFCSDCAESSDCMNGDICSPTIDLMTFSGQKGCVAPGSVQNGELCPLMEADGDMACMSGKCAEVTIMGIVQLGVCGECEEDGDCMMGQTCMPGELGMGGIAGSTCV
jgi:hypothetical protein